MFDKKAYTREYQSRPEVHKRRIEQKRKWRAENKDKVREQNKRRAHKIKVWALAHKEEKKRYDRDRRNRIKWEGNYEIVLERDGQKCTQCGELKGLVVHHIDHSGQSDNPNNNIENLKTLCRICHMRYHQKLNSNLPILKGYNQIHGRRIQ